MTLTRYIDEVGGDPVVSWGLPGPGPPVVCVHGAGVSSRQTLPVVRALAGRHEAWAVDLPGFGRSRSRKSSLTLLELAGACASWMQQRDLKNACLLGTSMGCQIVAEMYQSRPELVSSVLLVGPTMDPRMRSARGIAMRGLLTSPSEPLRLLPMNAADYMDAGPRRTLRAYAESMHDPFEDKLPHIDVPALVVRGSGDHICSRPWAEEVTRLLPSGRLRTVEGQGHTVSVGAPQTLADLVSDFLEEEGTP
ncbi:alpha/beta fold hydrolase [Allosalinactinospora lopnorensis]|uniref:alpha/beta fold hydrolase n=1 Tax=Allosalinactinospora lopnorensis TaxID=1352348 RepID=UPI000623D1FC|nr:alpha/beta hydrolase [Allosalinactinospora lopnorensis]